MILLESEFFIMTQKMTTEQSQTMATQNFQDKYCHNLTSKQIKDKTTDEKLDLFKQTIADLKSYDQRLSNLVISRILGKGKAYVSSVLNHKCVLSDKILVEWISNIYPHLLKRVYQYSQISTDQLKQMARDAYQKDPQLLASRLKLTPSSLRSAISLGRRTVLLNIYDAIHNIECYPTPRHIKQPTSLPLVRDLQEILNQLKDNLFQRPLIGLACDIDVATLSHIADMRPRNISMTQISNLQNVLHKLQSLMETWKELSRSNLGPQQLMVKYQIITDDLDQFLHLIDRNYRDYFAPFHHHDVKQRRLMILVVAYYYYREHSDKNVLQA